MRATMTGIELHWDPMGKVHNGAAAMRDAERAHHAAVAMFGHDSAEAAATARYLRAVRDGRAIQSVPRRDR